MVCKYQNDSNAKLLFLISIVCKIVFLVSVMILNRLENSTITNNFLVLIV